MQRSVQLLFLQIRCESPFYLLRRFYCPRSAINDSTCFWNWRQSTSRWTRCTSSL